jgi:hypothetical protein
MNMVCNCTSINCYRISDAKLFDISEESLLLFPNITDLLTEKINNVTKFDAIVETFANVISVEIDFLSPNGDDIEPYQQVR